MVSPLIRPRFTPPVFSTTASHPLRSAPLVAAKTTNPVSTQPRHQASQPPATPNRYGNRRFLSLVLGVLVSPSLSSFWSYGLVCSKYHCEKQQSQTNVAASPPLSTSISYGAYPLARDKRRNPNAYGLWAFISLGLGMHLLNIHTKPRPTKPCKISQLSQRYNLILLASKHGLSVYDSSTSAFQLLNSPSTPLLANPITDLLVSGLGESSYSYALWLWKSYTATFIAGIIEDSASTAPRVQLFDHFSPMVTIFDQVYVPMGSKIGISRHLQVFCTWVSLQLCCRLVLSYRIVISTSLAKSFDFLCAIVLRD